MDIFDVVMRLNGPVNPVGDSRIDSDRLGSLQSLCALTGKLLDRITDIAEATDDHMASVKAAKDVAAAFLASAQSERIARLEEALREVRNAWAYYERHGEISHLDGQPLIYASTLEALADYANTALEQQ